MSITPFIRKEIKYTLEQGEALDNLVAAAGDRTYAQMVRRLIKQEAERLGLPFAMNMPDKVDTARVAQAISVQKRRAAKKRGEKD